MKHILWGLFAVFMGSTLTGQDIILKNPSFEGRNDFGRIGKRFVLDGWTDCGQYIFKTETPPDVQPVQQWGKKEKPLDGNTFVGMVIRENNSWESITQRLSNPMVPGHCYEFSIAIQASDTYMSQSAYRVQHYNDKRAVPFTHPTVLRIWGSNNGCDQAQLLGESPPVSKQAWHRYTYTFKPTEAYKYLLLEAFYQTPVPNMQLYNGHIMIDAASNLKMVPCPVDDEILAVRDTSPAQQDEETNAVASAPSPKKETKASHKKRDSAKTEKDITVAPSKPKKKKEYKILEGLNSKNIAKGQIFEVKNLYFEADTTVFLRKSENALDDVYEFLDSEPDVVIEIGGHTNGQPSHEYCDALSKKRAETVANYLINKGIDARRIKTKGYGKRKPLASNKTLAGRNRNQRVEIKILET